MKGAATTTTGPSWYDVQEYMKVLESMYHRNINVTLARHQESRTGESYWTVTVASWSRQSTVKEDVIGANAQFRGNGGASTITAAIYWALSQLDEMLGERADRATGRTLF